MEKILIVGAGFAGLAASRILRRIKKEAQLTIIDKNSYSNFLPLLPDVFGRRINPNFLVWPLERLNKIGINFINEEVTALDLAGREVSTLNSRISYDYLLLACGSETNFYGNDMVRQRALKLDDAFDARSIISSLENKGFDSCLIAGGGYTGIEISCGLRRYFQHKKIDKEIIIVERAPQILGPLPSWMRDYVSDNLSRLNIRVLTGTFIDGIKEDNIRLSSGEMLEKSLLIWAAGVRTPGFIQNLNIEKNPQGRIKVDEYLRFAQGCFAAGDVANFSYKNNFLRMAVQFAITEGELAADNIVRQIKGLPLKKYRPLDLGYVIPMANNRSCGRVMGLKFRGWLATFLHYSMCIYRSLGIKNKFGLSADLLKGGG
ncbi:MAG: FAD-dependent oxidoreductase [bacterium]